MQTRTYGELFKLISALCGTGQQLAVPEQDQLRHFINRRFEEAFNSSPVWPRYFVSSEERNIVSLLLSGATAGTDVNVNQNFRLIGSNSGSHGKKGTSVYQGVTTETVYIYKTTDDAWRVASGITGKHTIVNSEVVLSSAGTEQFIETDVPKKANVAQVETWDARGASTDLLLVVVKNLIPYAETGKDTIGDFNRIHRKQAFLNNSSLEYEFFVDFDGANILNIANSADNSAFVSYKKQFTPFTITSGYYDSTVEVPGEFFNYLAHTAFADFIRMQGKSEQAAAEEGMGTLFLAQELEKIDLRSNNNTINKRFSTYVNRQAR
tara:strand:- start:370 stop:1335 length:966 start_codon:yes stop_codon:yes gene_type:complete